MRARAALTARALVLATAVVAIPALWAAAPYGEKMFTALPETFASATVATMWEVLTDLDGRGAVGVFVLLAELALLVAALAAPLYPAVLSIILLTASRRTGSIRRWAWIVQGAAVVLLAPFGGLFAGFRLIVIAFGRPDPPPVFVPLWALPGVAMAAGLGAMTIGIAPDSRIARLLLPPASSSARTP